MPLSSKEQLDIIKGSLNGEVDQPAYIAIQEAEQLMAEETAIEQQGQDAQEQPTQQPTQQPEVASTGGTAPGPNVPPSQGSSQPHLVNSASSMEIGINQAQGSSRGATTLGTDGTYKKGGPKIDSPPFEVSMCSNGEWNGQSVKTGCGYRDSAHNLYGSAGITLGDISDKSLSGSARGGLGYSTHVPYSPITGHLGLSGGTRFNMTENDTKFQPIFDATGSVGMEGEFGGNSHNWREPWKYGAGVYGKQDLTGGTGTTVGLYGNVGKFSGKVGYNRNTGPEATIGFGLPIRKEGGFKYEDGGPKRPKSKADITKLQQLLESEGFDIGKTGADGDWGKNTQKAFNKYTKRTSAGKTSLWERVKGGIEKSVNPFSFSQAAQTYAQYMGNALLQGSGLVGQDESYFDVDENDLRADEVGAYKSMLRQNLNKGKKGKIDYREYSNEDDINNASSSESARQILKKKSMMGILAKDNMPTSGSESTKHALHALTGNARYTIDDDGNVHVQDNYDFNYSQKKQKKSGTTISELWKHMTKGKYSDIYDNAHSVGDQVKSRIPVDISLGSATDMGLTPQEIESLQKYNKNSSGVKKVSTWDLMKRTVGFKTGGFKYQDGGMSKSGNYELPKFGKEKKMPYEELLRRQRFQESSFDHDAVSPKGATGVAQIMPDTLDYAKMKGWVPKSTTMEDVKKFDLAKKIQVNYMNNLIDRDWNKGSEKVKRAKALIAYNWGPKNTFNKLTELKKAGVDIYSDDLSWLSHFNEESRGYVGRVLQGKGDFEEQYKKGLKDNIPLKMKGGGTY